MPSRFRFQGHAVGAAGQIRSPFQEVIEVQAASALPEIGGYGSGRSSAFRYREILHFDLAHTEVTGSQCPDCDKDRPAYRTVIKSTIEGLNVMGVLTADRIVAHIVSTYRTGGDGEPSVKLLGTRFENLRIAGIPVRVDLAVDVFDRFDTHASFQKAYGSDGEVRRLFEDAPERSRLAEAPATVQRWFHDPAPGSELPSTKGITSTSLVRSLQPESAAVSCWGHVIQVDGFGVIRLAEIDITQFTRRVTMVQLDLDCPVHAVMMMCHGEDGGTEW